jgi:hypothetical protein
MHLSAHHGLVLLGPLFCSRTEQAGQVLLPASGAAQPLQTGDARPGHGG